jgi:hypothetical protein
LLKSDVLSPQAQTGILTENFITVEDAARFRLTLAIHGSTLTR